jgi:hypothetical protein
MTDERKKEIRALADAATGPAWEIREVAHEETPWSERRVYRVEINAPQYTYGRRTHSRHVAQIIDYANWTDHPANAKFIAAARTAVPELLDHIEELEQSLEARVLDPETLELLIRMAGYAITRVDDLAESAGSEGDRRKWKDLWAKFVAARAKLEVIRDAK